MPRNARILQFLAALASIVVFGLMLTAAGRLLLGGPTMDRVLAALPLPASDRVEPSPSEDDILSDRPSDASKLGESIDSTQGDDAEDGPVTGFSSPDSQTTAPRAEAEPIGSDRAGGAADAARGDELAAGPSLAPNTAPELRLRKRLISSEPAAPGETIEFQIELSNVGSVPLTGVYIADAFEPAELAFLAADPPPDEVDAAAGTVTWPEIERMLTDGRFDPGETLMISARFRAIAADAESGLAVNRARAGAREGNVSVGPVETELRIVGPAEVCLGNQVFLELIEDGRYDPAQGDLGLADVALSLFVDSDESGDFGPADELEGRTWTSADGTYAFCELEPGAYLLRVDAENFASGGPLEGLISSGSGQPAPDLPGDPNDDIDHDDNGATAADGLVYSLAIQLSPGMEPGPEIDGDERNSNLSLDLGFVLSDPSDPVLPPPALSEPGASPDAEPGTPADSANPAPDRSGGANPPGSPPGADASRHQPGMPHTGRAGGKPIRYEGPVAPRP